MGFAQGLNPSELRHCVPPVARRAKWDDLPDGQITDLLSSHTRKNIPLLCLVETDLLIPSSTPQRGVSRSSRTRGWMRWTRQRFARDGVSGRVERPVSDHRHADERCCCGRRSRVVLTPRRWRQVRGWQVGPTGRRRATHPLTTVANKPGHRGEHEGNR
jgi:hypothetical protein